MHMYVLVGLHFEANHIFLAFIDQRFHLFGRHGQRVSHLHTRTGVILKIRYRCALGLQLFGGIKRNIRMAAVQQLLYILMVYLATLRLTIRSVLANGFYLAVIHTKTFVNADA